MVDRSKYAGASPEEMESENQKINNIIFGGSSDFLKIGEGTNVFRWYPAHLTASSSLFLLPKVTVFLPKEFKKKGKDGEPDKIEIKKAPIFNSRVHGNTPKDLVEEYVKFTVNHLNNLFKKEAEILAKKLAPITAWDKGINYQKGWVGYALKRVGDNKIFGRLDISDGIKRQMDILATRKNEADNPVILDLYSPPVGGKPIQITKDSKKPGKDRYKVAILFEENWELTNEELEKFESEIKTLESLYKNSFRRADFELQLKGLKIFDEQNGYRIFDVEEWLKICEEISAYYPEDNSESSSESESNSDYENSEVESEEKVETSHKTPSSSQNDSISSKTKLSTFNRAELQKINSALELNLTFKITQTPIQLREILFQTIIERFEFGIVGVTEEKSLIAKVDALLDEISSDVKPETVKEEIKSNTSDEVDEKIKEESKTNMSADDILKKYQQG